MANEVHELVVKLSPEGAKETREELDKTNEEFTDTVDNVEGESDKLEAFSERWKGAMGVVVTGLSVATAGLLSMIPILSEAFSGLSAILQSTALAMDTLLRPVLTPVTNAMFGLANAIDRTEGPARLLVGLIGLLVSGFTALTGAVVTLTGYSLAGWLSAVAGAASTAAGAIAGFLGSTVGVVASVVTVVTALGLLGSELLGITNVTGIAEAKMNSFLHTLGLIGFAIGGPITSAIEVLIKLLSGDIPGAFDLAERRARQWVNVLGKLMVRVNAAFMALGQSLRTIFETTWRVVMHFTKKALNEILHMAEGVINRIISNLNILPGFDLETVEFETFATTSIEQIAREQRRRGRRRLRAVGRRARRMDRAFTLDQNQQGGQDRPSNRFAEDMNININVDDTQFGKAVNASVDKGVSDRGR